MTKSRINPWVNYKDVSVLTEYENKIYNLLTEGKNYAEIAEILNNKPLSVKSRIPTIREKVALHELTIKQDGYGAFR